VRKNLNLIVNPNILLINSIYTRNSPFDYCFEDVLSFFHNFRSHSQRRNAWQ